MDAIADLADRSRAMRLVLQVERASGMSLTEAIGSGHIGVMEIIETIYRTDVTAAAEQAQNN